MKDVYDMRGLLSPPFIEGFEQFDREIVALYKSEIRPTDHQIGLLVDQARESVPYAYALMAADTHPRLAIPHPQLTFVPEDAGEIVFDNFARMLWEWQEEHKSEIRHESRSGRYRVDILVDHSDAEISNILPVDNLFEMYHPFLLDTLFEP